MKVLSIIFLVVFSCFAGIKNDKDAEAVLREMHNKYAGKWYKSFTFTQTTEQFRNDSLLKTSTWYEAIIFPDKFRIDFGEKKIAMQ